MDDRVRIYELAKRMNVSNQEIIDALRELGYDVKSHSSTVDKQAVGLLIQKLKKNNETSDAAKGGPGKQAPAKPGAAKGKMPPPAPPELAAAPVKPRVLGRYRPTPPPDPNAPVQQAEPPVTQDAPAHQDAPHAVETPVADGGAQKEAAARTNPVSSPESESGADASSTVQQTHNAQQAAEAPQLGQTAAPGAADKTKTGQTQGHIINQSAQSPVKPPVSQPSQETIKAPQPPTQDFEPLDTRGKFTGDEWSDNDKWGKKTIRKLDLPKKKDPSEAKADEKPAEPAAKADAFGAAKAGAAGKEKDKFEKGHKPKGKEHYKDDLDEFNASGQEPARPMTPSQPIRVAAPSNRGAHTPRKPGNRQGHGDKSANKKEEKQKPEKEVIEIPKEIVLTNSLTVQELAIKMHVPETEIIKNLFMRNIMRTVNQPVELELAKELAVQMGYEVLTEEKEPEVVEAPVQELSEEDKANLVMRPPVVTIMGHVDHGKTSLLDAIRQTKFLLTDAEAGGITQHIGAYHVEVPDEDGHPRQIVFLDTPGHEAFTAMRARGAKVTDVAILVVAADDGVMPQTIEAIDHAKAAGVPIIVAVNKIDKPGADPDRVLSQLMEHGLVAEKYGGEVVTCEVSAKKRMGLDYLLEMILLVADILDLKADPDKPATGFIVEAELSKSRGAVATALVENGTMREGDFIVAGSKVGRVRALFDDRGQRIKGAGPSMPVEVLGFNETPVAGERFQVVENAQRQKELAESHRGQEAKQHHVSLETLHDMLERGEVKDLNVIVKADVQGTAEAIADQIRKLSGSEVQVRVLRTASGDISENDVNLAASSNAIIVGFNAQPDANASRVAEGTGVDIRTYSIIYQITDDLELAIQGLLKPIRTEVAIGQAEVRQVFKVGKGLTIAGCMVVQGKVQRNSIARIERNGQLLHEGKLDTLKRFKDDAKEVAQGFECGMSFDKFSDLQVGDMINCFVIQETKRTEQSS
ncbi:MAG: translation initiation factor IF-2 [Candidatus Melainabacteria bacterium]|jgi:translation initiation factor IF-2|nr:translation initiation factor IF-2 [Candidatus Melainabacteria bacterium]